MEEKYYDGESAGTAFGTENRAKALPDLAGIGVLKDLPQALGALVPAGSKALFIAGEGKSEQIVREVVARKYRISAAIVSDEDRAGGLKSFAASIKADEDVKLVVAAGDGRIADAGKFAAARYRLPLCVVALSQADINYHTFVSVLVGADGTSKYRAVKPSLAVFDYSLYPESDVLTAAGFGAACARLTAAFDLYVYRLLGGDGDENSAFCDTAKIAAKLLSSDKITAAEVGESAAKLSAAAGRDPSILSGGTSGAAEILEALKRKGGEKPKFRGENEMLLALPLIRSYAAFFALLPALPVAVPDENLRAELLAKKLGVSPFATVRGNAAKNDFGDLGRKIYVLSEYRRDLAVRCVGIEKTLVFAAKRMKRLYKDKGYSYNNYVTANDLRICFALAPDVRGAGVTLKIMRQAGYLEKLASDAAKISA